MTHDPTVRDPDVAAESLADVLARENEALKRHDYQAAAALVAAKQAALTALQGAPLPAATPALTRLAQRLHALSAENNALLEQAIQVQTRVIEIVAGAYRPPAQMLRYGRKGTQMAASLSGVAFSARA